MVSKNSCLTKNRPHVVLINTWAVINARGGAEKIFASMANALVAREFQVTAICCEPKKGEPGYFLDPAVRFVNAYREPTFSFIYRSPWRNFFCYRITKAARKCAREIFDDGWKRNSIKHVLSYIPPADVIVSFQMGTTHVLRQLRVTAPVVTMLHSPPVYYAKQASFSIYRESVDSCSVLQVLLPEFEDQARKEFPHVPIVTIPNVVQQFKEASNCKAKKIVCLARLESGKRPELLVEAFALLHKRFPDWICEWWGDHTSLNTKTRIISLIRKYGLEKNFLLPGTTSNVEPVLQSASIFAFPSRSEGFGLALAEAFSAGLPAVGCKDCMGVNSLIHDGANGFLTDSTPKAFASGLARLMENEDLRKKFGNVGREEVKLYSAEQVWSSWEKLLQGESQRKRSY